MYESSFLNVSDGAVVDICLIGLSLEKEVCIKNVHVILYCSMEKKFFLTFCMFCLALLLSLLRTSL